MLFAAEKNPKMEEIRNYISVSSSAKFEHLIPHIKNAERDYLIPVIGLSMYEELQEFYDEELTDLSSGAQEETAELIKLVQSAMIHIAFWIGFDVLNTYISDGGFKQTNSADVKGLYKYQEENLKNYFRTNGFNGIDVVLKYLEDHLTDFGEFKSSPAYTLFRSSFIQKTETFNKIVYINNSRLTFLRMKTHMDLIEAIEIAPILGPVAYAYLKAQLLRDSPDVKVTTLIPFIQKPIAFLASAMLMEESGADLLDNGLYFTSTGVTRESNTIQQPAAGDRIATLVMRNRSFGEIFLNQLRIYLLTNSADWSDVAPSTGKVLRRDNTGKKTFFA